MYLTSKQLELLRHIGDGNPDNVAIDLDQLLDRTSYKPSKQSIQFSLRALIAHGLIKKGPTEKRRNRMRAIIELTDMGRTVTGKKKAGYLESLESEEVLEELSAVFDE